MLDVSTPGNPTVVGFHDTPIFALDVVVAPGGVYVYVADGYVGGLRVFDVSVPSNPTEVGFYDTPGEACAVAVAPGGDFVSVADDWGGILILYYIDTREAIYLPILLRK